MTSDRRARPPLPKPLGPALEPIYRAVVGQRNRAFDQGRRVQRVPAPVISIGNLSVGGTGKTPVVAAIVRMLADHGHTPGIAMRGYKSGPSGASDEQLEYAESAPGVPVAAMPDRAQGARRLIRDHDCTCIVLDDGFQHRFLHRDLDIVLLDATRPVTEDRCLPAGWLREPVESLSRAHAFIVTHAESADPDALDRLRSLLERRFPGTPLALVEHAWSDVLDTGGGRLGLDHLQDLPCTLASGIGNPTAFEQMARRHGVLVRTHHAMPDHHHWTPQDLDRLDTGRDGAPVLTTRKDWVKIGRLDHPLRRHFLIAEVSIRFRSGEDTIRSLVLTAAG